MSASTLEKEFRRLFGAVAVRNPALVHEWRDKSSSTWGRRLDLVCAAGTPSEVYATVFESSVAVGDATGHTDVEDFGRGLSDGEIAQEATSLLEAKLEEHGLITAVGRPNKSLERTREG